MTKSNYLKSIIIVFLGLLRQLSFAQIDSVENRLTNELSNDFESYVENTDGQFDFDSQLERLELLAIHPLELNSASETELIDSELFSELQIAALGYYISEFGPMVSIYELQGIPTFSYSFINSILPYVIVRPYIKPSDLTFKTLIHDSRKQLFFRLTRGLNKKQGFLISEGDTIPAYEGDQNKIYAKFKLSYRDQLSFGFTAEKDAGESIFSGSNPAGFDFYSGHLFLNKVIPILRKVAIGDYKVSIGQGLLLWNGFGARKGITSTRLFRNRSRLRPYTSANEFNFLRGAAATFHLGKKERFQLLLFTSLTKRDGKLIEIDTITDSFFVRGLQSSGLHRTKPELTNKNTVKDRTNGGSLLIKHPNWRIGFNAIYTQLSQSLIPNITASNQFNFSGKTALNGSINYRFFYNGFQFHGETAISKNGGLATQNSLNGSLDDATQILILHRYYSRTYQTLHGVAFGENSRIQNETGFYIGIQNQTNRKVNISAYVDIFSFHWLKSSVDAPSKGFESVIRTTYIPNWGWTTYAQYKFEHKEANLKKTELTNKSKMGQIGTVRRNYFRLNSSKRLGLAWSIDNRLELSNIYSNGEHSKGLLFYQGLQYKLYKYNFKFQLRYAVFDIEDFMARIYTYEQDLLHSFSVPSFQGKGSRLYLNVYWKPSKNLGIWFRISQSNYIDRSTIGSGNEKIDGPMSHEIKAQIRWRF